MIQMIKHYLKVIALKRILEKYEDDIEECISYSSSSCIIDKIDKYSKLIEGLANGEN